MNLSSLLGILLAFGVFLGAAFTSTKDYSVFLDYHAVLIVIGGTLSATLISFSFKNVLSLLRIFFSKILGNPLTTYEKVIHEIVDSARLYRENEAGFVERVKSIQTPFLREALQMMIEGGLDHNEMDEILYKRAMTHFHRYEDEAEMFKTMAKFPPAFGLLGAVLGIIAMMQNLGGADAFSTVGPALAVALTATLYGIALANFVFIPIGENLVKFNNQDFITRQMIIDGVKLIRIKKQHFVLEENIKSYLLPAERKMIRKVA
jgi:chemotaxis protein MotA